MTIRFKLLVPVAIQLIGLAAVLVLVVASIAATRRDLDESDRLSEAATALRGLQRTVEAYHQTFAPSDELEQELGAAFTGWTTTLDAGQVARLTEVRNWLKDMGEKKRDVVAMEREIMTLTEESCKHSDDYITGVVSRLADAQQADSVSELERLMITSAHANSTWQNTIQKMFYRWTCHAEIKGEMLDFMARIIGNALEAVEQLKGTPFQEIPVKACEANQRIDGLLKAAVARVDAIDAAKSRCDRALQSLAAELGESDRRAQVVAVGHVRGAFVLVGLIVLVSGLVTMVLNTVLARQIVRSLRTTADMLHDISEGEGDLTKRLRVASRDEVGRLAEHFNRFTDKLQKAIHGVAGNTSTLAAASTGLSATAAELADSAEQATVQTSRVSSAAERMSANMNAIAASTEQVSANVKGVAAAVEELTASIAEISQSVERAACVAGDADELVVASNARVGELGKAADEIGKVIEVIQDIAEQTNLLALNATIEAARAGDAGKGFAVVATEVKELARQTGSATEDIRRRIEGIQTSSGTAVHSIADISAVIRQVSELSRAIASTVEEQNATTKEIARNLAQSSSAVASVAAGVAESALAAREITSDVSAVDQGARQAAQGAICTKTAGDELAQVVAELRELVGSFRT